MRTAFTLLLAVALSPLLARSQPAIKRITINDLERTIAGSDHPLIVNFWATYCVPCITEIPYFQSTVAQYKAQQVELILVSLDFSALYPARIAAFAQERAFTAPIVWLDETNAGFYSRIDPRWTGGIPASLFINNKNHYRRFFDRQLTALQIGPEIKKMLDPSGAAAGGR